MKEEKTLNSRQNRKDAMRKAKLMWKNGKEGGEEG